MNKIGIIGVGYVGSACEMAFSSVPSIEVLVYDKYKPTESLQTVVSQCSVLFLCLPTPMNDDGSCNTSVIEQSVKEITCCTKKSKTLVIKSTVPPGTTEALQHKYPQHQFYFNPEFLTEKNFIDDFANQKLIVLGVPNKRNDKKAQLQVDFIYDAFASYQKKPAEKIWTTAKAAELFKYTANTFLAAKVSFLNEIYEICDACSIPYDSVRDLLERDERIGHTHLRVPGPDGKFGFSGSCFPKDTKALIAFAKDAGVDPLVLESVWAKNLMVRDDHEWEDLPQVNGHYATA